MVGLFNLAIANHGAGQKVGLPVLVITQDLALGASD